MDKNLEAEQQADVAVTGRRRTERLKLTIPIRVMCFGGRMGDFVEDTYTLLVNRDGALIVLRHRVAPDDAIRVVNLENLREADFRVVGPARLGGPEVAEWGVECLEKERTLWEIDFPPPLEAASLQAGALLECRRCGKQSLLVLSLVEIDILESVGELQKLCTQCGQVSTWAYADVTRRPTQSSSSRQPPLSPQVGKWDGKSERRVYKRIALKLHALVRNSKGERETGKTENLSKGGLAICLSMVLKLGEIVAVVCPYSGGGQEIERKAEVRYLAPFIAGEKWFYGLRYVPE